MTRHSISPQKQYQMHYIEPHRGAPDAWFKIMAGPPLDVIDVELNRNELGFLLQSKGQVWQSVVMEERRFYVVKALVDDRNERLERAFLKLEEAGISHGAPIKISEIEKIIGPMLFQQLSQMGAALIDHVDKNVISSKQAFVDLRNALQAVYPGQSFISMKDKDAAPLKQELKAPEMPVPPPTRKTLSLRERQRPPGKYIPHIK